MYEHQPDPERIELSELYAMLDTSNRDSSVASGELFNSGMNNLAAAIDRGDPRKVDEAEEFMKLFLDVHPEYRDRIE